MGFTLAVNILYTDTVFANITLTLFYLFIGDYLDNSEYLRKRELVSKTGFQTLELALFLFKIYFLESISVLNSLLKEEIDCKKGAKQALSLRS